MRITQNMTARMLLSDLGDVSDRLQKTQQRIASGKQLTTPSDDPYAVSRALQLRGEVSAYEQYGRNVTEAAAWQSATDTALSNVADLTGRARELVVEAANGTLSAGDRSAIAAELEQLIGSVQAAGNAQYGSRYVLAGSATTTTPFVGAVGSVAYAGDTGAVTREIGHGETLQVNVDGTAVAGMLTALQSAWTHMTGANPTTTLQGDLSALDTAQNALSDARAQAGAVGSRLETAGDRIATLQESVTKLLSQTEDADMAQTLVDYSTQQAVYQAALKAGANLIQPSLLDFLR